MATNTIVDQGNSVPAICQHPECSTTVHRGIVHICGADPTGAGPGCGLHFCGLHLGGPGQTCERCAAGQSPFATKAAPDFPEWRLTDPHWKEWRDKNPELLQRTYGRHMAKIHQAQNPTPAAPGKPEKTKGSVS